jgi:predicted transposase YbfD/YdcC
LLAELGVADGAIVTLDALHCQKNTLVCIPQGCDFIRLGSRFWG